MNIDSEQWKKLLETGAAQLQLSLSHDQTDLFVRYAQLLITWNKKINLTGITDPEEVAVKHFLDSLAPSDQIPTRGSLLDIGSGGGFPGIPLKIVRPKQPMVLIDGVRKKINFIKAVIRELDLERIEALHVRAEDYLKSHRASAGFDVIVSRALADVDAVVRLAAPLLNREGRLVIYQGPRAMKAGAKNETVRHGDMRFVQSITSFQLPHTGDRRTVVVLDRSF